MDRDRELSRKDEATDDRTLEELEEQQKSSVDESNSPMPRPDEGSDRKEDNEERPM